MTLVEVNDSSVRLNDPVSMPHADAFLWNPHMMLQMNCRGYATAQHMQPEPAKYTHAPNLEAKTFMQPEQALYAHHPGRFIYVKDEETGTFFSAPHEPVRATPDQFQFTAKPDEIEWLVCVNNIEIKLNLNLAAKDPVELWRVHLKDLSGNPRKISLYFFAPVGNMSWMNQSGCWRDDLCGVVCSSVTPYQKVEDFFKNHRLKDKTYLLSDRRPDAWEVRRQFFEGEGGLHHPDGLRAHKLACQDAHYEEPACIMQYQLSLAPHQSDHIRFIFGPALDDEEIRKARLRYINDSDFKEARSEYAAYMAQAQGCLIETPDKHFDHFVNTWLPRQVFYHGDVNRLTTDPQTRNYLQDNLGMCFINPEEARKALIFALSQQNQDGSMPDGILLSAEAELKYINQVPHTDHCVWVPILGETYIRETGDINVLGQCIPFADGSEATVFEHVQQAMNWLYNCRDHRGLNYIAQGDWCDPMNMVGYKGKGVSGWLTLATAYAFEVWARICSQAGRNEETQLWRGRKEELNRASIQYLWKEDRFARGITDAGRVFGTASDSEGSMFLNPQTWAILSEAANDPQTLASTVLQHLETPYGVMLLNPAFTHMHEDIGRVTQKFPGTAENGSVYNHAAAFFIFSLYQIKRSNHAFRLLRAMLPGPTENDYHQRTQLPTYIPNYYRGAVYQYPRTAGRSSRLFNTGSAAWFYRCVVEGLFGLKGELDGMAFDPMIPDFWSEAKITRNFRGAKFIVSIKRTKEVNATKAWVNQSDLPSLLFKDIQPGKTYHVTVKLPLAKAQEA